MKKKKEFVICEDGWVREVGEYPPEDMEEVNPRVRRPRGRPKKDSGYDKQVSARLSKKEYRLLMNSANKMGMTESEFIRLLINKSDSIVALLKD